MTTTPNPTAAEREKAAAYAEYCAPCSLRHGPPIDDEGILALSRCYLALKAQLAESERARLVAEGRIDSFVASWEQYEKTGMLGYVTTAGKALAADQTTARESAENTAEETMDPGPDDFPGTDEGSHFMSQDKIEMPRPAPAQTPEPAEPNRDDALAFLQRCFSTYSPGYEWSVGSVDLVLTELLRCYRAGLAAEAAAHAETRRELEEAELSDASRHKLLEEVEGELERVRGQLALVDAAHVEATTERDTLRAQARARRVPTRDDLARMFHDALPGRRFDDTPKGDREMWYVAADAVLRLFAEAPPIGVEELARVLFEMGESDEAKWPKVIAYWSDVARAAMTALGFQDSPGASPEGDTCPSSERSQLSSKPSSAQSSPSSPPSRETCGQSQGIGSSPASKASDTPASRTSSPRPTNRQTDATQPSPLVTSDNEPPVPLPEVLPAGQRWFAEGADRSQWGTFTAKAQLRGDGIYIGAYTCPWVTWATGATGHIPSRLIDWSHYRAQQRAAEPTPWKPTVGERAVLVSCGRWDHQRSHQGVEWTVLKVDEADSRYRYHCQRDDGFHVWFPPESTWRPASAAPAKAVVLCAFTSRDEQCSAEAGKNGYCARHAPSPQPGGFLDALTDRVTELERRMTRRQTQAQETNDRLARLERDSHAPVDFTTAFQRLDELELQARVARRARLESGGHETAAELLARIEREERELQSNKP